eukprot:TRINITY_DN1985_c0_g1_i3.p1 TRINITY_DN1985_c0_g1~~TRINITY_DN1985_c0_g1_i3.p1  ORF type:complete len:643 (-),score=135.96 TRINITY_DN1985_c0_g1_i3:41-1969(-)
MTTPMFETLFEGIKFFEDFFKVPFPFSKYDSIFCPEYNVGAMENPGAITFNESLVWREAKTKEQILILGIVVLHELCHMWFGNLVTMKWWDDLWLNESFAQYVSLHCLARVSPRIQSIKYSDPALLQMRGTVMAMNEDQKPTTHPIAADCLNTKQSETNFDAITYHKGCAVLKQLMFLIGEEAFSNACSNYFNKFKWKNAELSDFLGALEEAGSDQGFQAQPWKASWLQTAGVNECIPEWNPLGRSAQEKVVIRQTAAVPNYPTLRQHRLFLAFFDEEGRVYQKHNVLVKAQTETAFYYDFSHKAPSAVLVNYGEQAFMKILLDEKSRDFFLGNLAKIEEQHTRAIIWVAFWNMVRDARLSGVDFVSAVIDNISRETDTSVLSLVLTYTISTLDYFVPAEQIIQFNLREKLFNVLKTMLISERSTHVTTLLKRFFISFAKDESAYSYLEQWINGSLEELNHVELGLDTKWSILVPIFRSLNISLPRKYELLRKQETEDKSDFGKKMKLRLEAQVADDTKRREIWASFFDKTSKQSVKDIAKVMEGFNDVSNSAKSEAIYPEYFRNLKRVYQERDKEFGNEFFSLLSPLNDRFDENIQLYQDVLQNTGEELVWLKRKLQDQIDTLQRRKKAYQFARTNTQRKI